MVKQTAAYLVRVALLNSACSRVCPILKGGHRRHGNGRSVHLSAVSKVGVDPPKRVCSSGGSEYVGACWGQDVLMKEQFG